MFAHPVFLAASIAALAALATFWLRDRSRQTASPGRAKGEDAPTAEPMTFLFDGEELVDLTPAAASFLDQRPDIASEWDRFTNLVTGLVPDFCAQLKDMSGRGRLVMTGGTDQSFEVVAEYLGTRLRLTLTDMSHEGGKVQMDSFSLRAQLNELNDLRTMVAAAPALIWKTAANGGITWVNSRYLDLAHAIDPTGAGRWPPADVLPIARRSPAGRLWLEVNGKLASFDHSSQPFGTETLHFALPADGIAKAERALDEFRQTLTRTFAGLPIGMAVFDRNRQLTLFNPALTELTGLAPDLLLARLSLAAFLDQLRDRSILPEPKDYQSWRQKMIDLENAARSGRLEETWTLPSGQTYRVIGQPHPQGAIAFLFQDVSAEVSLTRRFRKELQLGQSVLDGLDEAIAVFDQRGDLISSNRSYARLWRTDPSASLGCVTLATSLNLWRSATRAPDAWDRLSQGAYPGPDKTEIRFTIPDIHGRKIACEFKMIGGGGLMAVFRRSQPENDAAFRRYCADLQNEDDLGPRLALSHRQDPKLIPGMSNQ